MKFFFGIVQLVAVTIGTFILMNIFQIIHVNGTCVAHIHQPFQWVGECCPFFYLFSKVQK